MTLSFQTQTLNPMGTKETTGARDWKFIVQLAVLISGIGGGLAANTAINERVARLEEQNKAKAETISDLRESMKSIQDELRKLREDMAARKIVGRIVGRPDLAGDKHEEQ